MYKENGVDFSPKSLNLVFNNGDLTSLTDGWFLFTIGGTTVNISSDKAIQLATNALKSYSWMSNGKTVSNFNVLPQPVSAVFHPDTKKWISTLPTVDDNFLP